MMAENTVRILRLGLLEYRKAYALQEHLVRMTKERITDGKSGLNVLLLLQHPAVYTTGMRTAGYSKLEENYLKSLGADFVRTNRGGLITFHGPGQLVAYPILNLRDFVPQTKRRKAALGMKWYVNSLEEVIIKVCAEFKLNGTRSPHTGVWIGDNKICAMGVHNSQLITSHGLAFNTNVDLSWFERIVPCGIEDKGVTSLSKELHRQVDVDEVSPFLIKHFAEQFSSKLVECTENEQRLMVPQNIVS